MQLAEAQKKYGIGLTGGIACGKSTVAQMIRGQGFDVIDADELSRVAVRPGTIALAKIVDHFGGKILFEDGQLNRRMLSHIIFKNPDAKAKLESIVHPAIQKELDQKLNSLGIYANPRFWFYEATLLFETGSWQQYREVWLIHCQEQTQLDRLKKRGANFADIAQDIIAAQMPTAEKLKKASIAISTECSLKDVESKVNSLLLSLKHIS